MSAITYEAQMLVRNACMGDMFSSDSKRLGRMLARMQMVWPLSSIICPILGGWLTTISLRLPMALSAAVVALSLAVVVPRIPETLPTAGRKPFTLGMGASPLSAIKLFTSGRRLRAVGLLQDQATGPDDLGRLAEERRVEHRLEAPELRDLGLVCRAVVSEVRQRRAGPRLDPFRAAEPPSCPQAAPG